MNDGIWIVLEDSFLFHWRYIIGEGFMEFTFHSTPVFLKAIQTNTQTPGQPWKDCSPMERSGNASWTEDILGGMWAAVCMGSTLCDPPALRSPWPPEYLQHQPSTHNLIRDCQTRNPTSSSQARPNDSLVGKWKNSPLSHFLQTHCLPPSFSVWGGLWPPPWIWKFLFQRVEPRSQAQTMHRNTESPLYVCLSVDRWLWCPVPFFQT